MVCLAPNQDPAAQPHSFSEVFAAGGGASQREGRSLRWPALFAFHDALPDLLRYPGKTIRALVFLQLPSFPPNVWYAHDAQAQYSPAQFP